MQFDRDESVHLNIGHPKNGPYFARLILEELKHVIWRFRSDINCFAIYVNFAKSQEKADITKFLKVFTKSRNLNIS